MVITLSASACTHLSRNKLWNHRDDGAIMEPCLWNPIYLSPPFQSIPEMSNSRAVFENITSGFASPLKYLHLTYIKDFLENLICELWWFWRILSPATSGVITVGVEKVLSQESALTTGSDGFPRRKKLPKNCQKFSPKKVLEKLKKIKIFFFPKKFFFYKKKISWGEKIFFSRNSFY